MQSTKAEPDLRGLALVIMTSAWLAGILLDFWLPLPSSPLLIGAAAAAVLLILLWRDGQGRLIMLIILCLLLGAWRYAIVRNDPHAISAFIGAGKLTVRGSVVDEPALQGRSRVLFIEASSESNNGGISWQDAHGQIEVRTSGALIEDPYGANYGDNVELQGKLQAPGRYSPPGVFAAMAFPRISVDNTGGNPIIAALFHLRVKLAGIIAQSLPQPEAALLIAILLGLRTPSLKLPQPEVALLIAILPGLRTPSLKPLINAFSVTGTIHLIVPSGFKITILAGLVANSTRWLYEKQGSQGTILLPTQKRRESWRRWLATMLVIGSIAAYTIVSGAGPSALRAGIMGTLLVVAPRIGRIYNIYTALALAALLMSFFNPSVLWDVGFQLSLLGTLGIVLFTPFFQRLLHPIEYIPLGHYIAEIIAVTLAAQTATWPILAWNFHLISLIAPIANVFTVPLLGVLIFLGMLVCATGLLFAPLGIICGWAAWPLLWYVGNIITWFSMLPGASLDVGDLSGLAWAYYGVLTLLTGMALRRWPRQQQMHGITPPPLLSRRTWRMIQFGAAVLMILATATIARAAQPDGRLTITFFSVGPTGEPAQGEAILVHTPDGKTILIDGGLDATSLGQELDNRLPFWQRSLDMVILTTPRSDHLAGLQDIVSRYQVGEVLDAGMLHPSTSYALWRRTVAEHSLHYVQVRQGTTIAVGSQVKLEVLWPPSPLHGGSAEVFDNSLVVRLVAPGLRILFLGATALSKFALAGLLSTIDQSHLEANVVQFVGEVGKAFPPELSAVLQVAQPSQLVITPAALSAKQRKAGVTSTVLPASTLGFGTTAWQVVQTAELGTIEVSSDGSGWNVNPGSG